MDGLLRERESWDAYFLRLAFMVSTRATCLKKQVGAVLVQDKHVRGTAYNGAPSGVPSCLDVDCLLEKGRCVRTIHAEANVVLQTDHRERLGATVYITHSPCWACANMLANSGVAEIVFGYRRARDYERVAVLLAEAGIGFRHHPLDERTIEMLTAAGPA